MDITLRNEPLAPSRKAVAFLKLFARNYKELEFGGGEFARMILER